MLHLNWWKSIRLNMLWNAPCLNLFPSSNKHLDRDEIWNTSTLINIKKTFEEDQKVPNSLFRKWIKHCNDNTSTVLSVFYVHQNTVCRLLISICSPPTPSNLSANIIRELCKPPRKFMQQQGYINHRTVWDFQYIRMNAF